MLGLTDAATACCISVIALRKLQKSKNQKKNPPKKPKKKNKKTLLKKTQKYIK
jgi:hypothetical protein